MGLFSGRDNTADRAAEALRESQGRARTELTAGFEQAQGFAGERQTQLREDFTRQRDLTEEGFDPFIQSALETLPGFQRSTTFEGRNESLQRIIDSPVFQSLRDEAERAGRGQFAASGQTGSSNALLEISKISPQLALQLEREQFERQGGLVSQGFQGVERRGAQGTQLTLGQGQLSSGVTSIQTQLAERLGLGRAGIETNLGDIESQRIIGDAAARAKRRGALLGTIGTGIGAVVGGPGGARIGGAIGRTV